MNPLHDPRSKSSHYLQKTSLRFKNKKFEFVSTQFIIDENYIGEPPRVQVGFSNLNDNIDENFLRKEISKVGQIRTLEIVRHPQTKRHLGLAKVQFEDPSSATKCVSLYNDHMLMGKKLGVFLDVRFNRIEDEKLKLLNPEPKFRPAPVQPKPPTSVPAPHPINQVPFTPIQAPPSIQPEVARANNRSSHAALSLDDRLAKLGLKQTGAYPPLPQQTYHPPERNSTPQQYYQNHTVPKQEKKSDSLIIPPTVFVEEDEKAWNPEPVKEEINLTEEQIKDEVLPYCFQRFVKELQRNLLTTLQRRLIQSHGYPLINEAQERHRMERDQKKLEELREKQENERKAREARVAMMLEKELKERKYVGRELARVAVQRNAEPVRFKRDNGLSRSNIINRSAALHTSHDRRQQSRGSSCETSSRHSRDQSPEGSVSSSSTSSSSPSRRSVSPSSSSSSSSSSSLSDRSFSSSSSSSRSPSPFTRPDSRLDDSHGFVNKSKFEESDLPRSPKVTEDKEKDAIEALLGFSSQTQEPPERTSLHEGQPSVKKRKKKAAEEKITIKKVKTEKLDDIVEPKPITFPPRSEKLISQLYSSLDLDLEDKKYLDSYHDTYAQLDERVEKSYTTEASEALILVKDNDIMIELGNGRHPKWWTGCSRCSRIEISDKGKLEEAVDHDLQKAAIKSHVIQAANSTRRDLRNDQRRIAALNPEIDPSLLKQFTSNTLQMRAKNLRFSRSKIHKWGLFACEKIANGDAVIEYVGEKIRPSVADHREKVVYTNLPTHDGSSYFFRVDSDVIDATLKGNKARFINHSCNPNCIAKVIKHENGTNSIVIYAKQAIDVDEEITYDYKFPREENENKIQCRCRAPNCQKYLN